MLGPELLSPCPGHAIREGGLRQYGSVEKLLDSCQLAEGLEPAPGNETKPEDLSVAEY